MSLFQGKEVEKKFAKLFNSVEFSTTKQDITEHWDLEIKAKIDVKGLKKRKRGDDTVDELIHWVELRNVNGKKGWLYGDCDYFAFELHDYWIIVDKEKLQKHIAENVIKKYSIIPMLYKLYKREGRKDIMTMVSSFDLIYMAECMIKKEKVTK